MSAASRSSPPSRRDSSPSHRRGGRSRGGPRATAVLSALVGDEADIDAARRALFSARACDRADLPGEARCGSAARRQAPCPRPRPCRRGAARGSARLLRLDDDALELARRPRSDRAATIRRSCRRRPRKRGPPALSSRRSTCSSSSSAAAAAGASLPPKRAFQKHGLLPRARSVPADDPRARGWRSG